MSSQKKPRPLFEVPDDIESGRESGWVYKSAGSARDEQPSASMVDTGSLALALGVAAVAQTFVLGLTIASIPMTISLRALHSFTKPD
jgi:hypothetical protein